MLLRTTSSEKQPLVIDLAHVASILGPYRPGTTGTIITLHSGKYHELHPDVPYDKVEDAWLEHRSQVGAPQTSLFDLIFGRDR